MERDCQYERALIRVPCEPRTSDSVVEAEKLYVAVGKQVEESRSTLLWGIQNSGGKEICIVHVHQPPQMILILGRKFHVSTLKEHEVKRCREIERQTMVDTLEEYREICGRYGVMAGTLHVEMESVEEGIAELISQHKIENLVMGAAADEHYSIKMREPMSKKALYIQLNAPAFCNIWFICKGKQICARIRDENAEGCSDSGSRIGTSENPFEIPSTGLPYNVRQNSATGSLGFSKASYHQLNPRDAEVAELSERLHEELRKRKDVEKSLEQMKKDKDKLIVELQTVNVSLQNKIKDYEQIVNDIADRIATNEELVEVYRKARDQLQLENESVLKIADELHQSAESTVRFTTTVSLKTIQEATKDFDSSLKLWEGDNWSAYKGSLAHASVFFKMFGPNSDGSQYPHEFQREVQVLDKLRHPNLLTLIGICPEVCGLLYEYLPNGNLEDRLLCRDNTPPLSWKSRIRIATELCSALIFLHTRQPPVVHGALRPACILLDSSFKCKLFDFGLSCPYTSSGSSSHTLPLYDDDPYPYTDPEILVTGAATCMSDVYSFGVILLLLLTGKTDSSTREILLNDFDDASFLWESSSGDWPSVQARQFAYLACRCCDASSDNRPDLESEVWKVLKPMSDSCGASFPESGGEEPSCFICPILQEVMRDPHVAADGYTYEFEAIRQWLDSGKNTSPMTNILLDHLNLIPNHTLRSAIQEWQEQHPDSA